MSDVRDVEDNDPSQSDLWASDALLDALGAGGLSEDDRASALLSALVSDVSATPLPALPLVPGPRRRHRLAPRTGVAGAALVAMLSTGGVAAASVNAGPTSPLFPLHQVLTGQPQLDGSQRQALEIKDRLKSATKALASGKVARAQKDVASAADRLPKVAATDGHKALAAAWTAISRQVKAQATATPTPTGHQVGTVLTPAPTHSPTPGRSSSVAVSTPPPAPTPALAPVTSVTSTTSPTGTATPAAGAAPTTGLTSPTPAPTTPTPSTVPSTTPSPSESATTGSATPTPTVTPSKHHKPGGGGKGGGGKGSGGSVAPGSPPASSLEPPAASEAPVTVPPASVAPVTVPPASVPAALPAPAASS